MEQTLLTFVTQTFGLAFLMYLIKDAEIFSPLRDWLKNQFTIMKVQGKWIGGKGLYLLHCHFCLSFWLALTGSIIGILPDYSFIYYPMSATLVYVYATRQ